MGKIAWLLFTIAGMLSSCVDSDEKFQSGKIVKENDSAETADSKEPPVEAVPPTSISGAWLVCQWLDQPGGQGACTIVDREGKKLQVPGMDVQFWKIVFRDGGSEVKTDFFPQPAESLYHVIFQILPDQVAGDTNLDIVYDQNGVYLVKNLTEFYQVGASPLSNTAGEGIDTPLKDLKVPQDKLASLQAPDRVFYLWPDPAKTVVDANSNGIVVARDFPGIYDPAQYIFNPDAFCGADGKVKSAVDAAWKTKLSDLANESPVRPEIVPGVQTIYLPAFEDCVLPIRTGSNALTAQSSDGSCMFMLVQKRLPPPGFSELQPYLFIFTKRFAGAVGFTAQDVERAANLFACTQ
jgi:hypothetical protein